MFGCGVDADEEQFAEEQAKAAEQAMALDERDAQELREDAEMFHNSSGDGTSVSVSGQPWGDADPWQ
eukprot:639308-Karenia_brevis.AAC.1